MLAVVSGVAAVAIAVYAWWVTSLPWAIGLGALLGGAVSHFGDRLLRGYVIDFINFFDWFIGNVADIAIVLSVVFLAVLVMLRVPTGRPAPAEAG